MATELLAIPEDYLAEFIALLRAALERRLPTSPPMSPELEVLLHEWCDDEEAYLRRYKGPEGDG
jgi:hypothetical protein